MISWNRRVGLAAVLGILGSVPACNDEPRFASGTSPRTADADPLPTPPAPPEPTPSATPVPDPTPVPDTASFTGVEWNLNCLEEAGAGDPEPELPPNGRARVFGDGPHAFVPQSIAGKEVTIQGSLCAPATRARRIVLVLDVSGSMESMVRRPFNDPVHRGNDPVVGNESCGRLAAVRALAKAIEGDSDAAIAVTTFADDATATSPGFAASGDQLLQQLVARYAASTFEDLNRNDSVDALDILCAGGGGTNYEAGLRQAEALLQQDFPPNVSRELYFISDGLPNTGKDGVAIANGLKASGVLIGTLMLNGDEAVLRDQIASRDRLGVPYHAYVQNADALATTLARLLHNEISDGFVDVRAIGGAYAERFPLEIRDDLQFVLPNFILDPALAPGGLEITLEYWDRNGEIVSREGQLVWSASAP